MGTVGSREPGVSLHTGPKPLGGSKRPPGQAWPVSGPHTQGPQD